MRTLRTSSVTFGRCFPVSISLPGLRMSEPSGHVQEFSHILNDSYPNDWLYHYAKNGYAEVDPVLVSHAKNFQTQVWTSTYKKACSKKEEAFIEHARSFGLAGGVTAGAFDSQRGLCSFFSFAGTAKAENPRYAGALEYLAHHLHHPLVQNTPSPSPVMTGSLSPKRAQRTQLDDQREDELGNLEDTWSKGTDCSVPC